MSDSDIEIEGTPPEITVQAAAAANNLLPEKSRESIVYYGSVIMDQRFKTNPAQWSVLLDFAEENPMLLTKKFDSVNSKKKYNELWTEITNTLNSMGYVEKTTEKWQKAVADWKSKVKAKSADINKGLVKTGGGGPIAPLNENEKRLMAILGWTAVTGTAIGELGFDTNTSAISLHKDHTYVTTEGISLSPPPLSLFNNSKKISAKKETPQHVDVFEINRRDFQQKKKTNPSTPKCSLKQNTSNTIQDMHNETLTVLKEINANLGKMAATQEKLCSILEKLVVNQTCKQNSP